jgi:hypothetical protein
LLSSELDARYASEKLTGELLMRAYENIMRTSRIHEAFAVVAAALFAAGCGGRGGHDHGSAPGEGTERATLTGRGAALNVSVDNGDVYVILLDTELQVRVSVVRVRGAEVTEMPMAAPAARRVGVLSLLTSLPISGVRRSHTNDRGYRPRPPPARRSWPFAMPQASAIDEDDGFS